MSPGPSPLVIASRGSRLALRQAQLVAALLSDAHPSITVTVMAVSTTGDRDHRSFGEIGGRGLFVKDVERALIDGRADAAVHSAKDLTAEPAEGCAIVCVPGRAEVVDVVVGGTGVTGEQRLAALPAGARVGTSSMRRRVLLAETRADLDVVELRGNLDTRLAKVRTGEADAAILAAAGVERLGAGRVAAPLDPGRWVPAPGQGALAVEALGGRADVAELFAPLDDGRARAEITCERAFARRIEGGCSVPLGCLARVEGSRLVASGFLGSPSGAQAVRDRISGPPQDAEALGGELAAAVLAGGGEEILADIREALPVEPAAP
jgi:hydroxymethylbilane synthase